MDGEAPCTQPLQEHVSAPEHTPVALVIAHLLLAHKRRGSPARGGGWWGALRGSPLSAPKDSGPAFFLHAVRFPGLADTHYRDPSASLALRFPPAARGAWCSRKVFSCALSCDPNPESPGAQAVLGRNGGTGSRRPASQGKGDQPGMGRGVERGISSFFL